MKKHSEFLKEYAKRLNEDDIKYLNSRLSQRLGGDIGEATEMLQRSQDMDHWLSSALCANNFFDMIDEIDFYVQQEMKKRFSGGEKQYKN